MPHLLNYSSFDFIRMKNPKILILQKWGEMANIYLCVHFCLQYSSFDFEIIEEYLGNVQN